MDRCNLERQELDVWVPLDVPGEVWEGAVGWEAMQIPACAHGAHCPWHRARRCFFRHDTPPPAEVPRVQPPAAVDSQLMLAMVDLVAVLRELVAQLAAKPAAAAAGGEPEGDQPGRCVSQPAEHHGPCAAGPGVGEQAAQPVHLEEQADEVPTFGGQWRPLLDQGPRWKGAFESLPYRAAATSMIFAGLPTCNALHCTCKALRELRPVAVAA